MAPREAPGATDDLATLLTRRRESLLRRWLLLVVERSSFDELASRSLGERIRELNLLLEALRLELAETSAPRPRSEARRPAAVARIRRR